MRVLVLGASTNEERYSNPVVKKIYDLQVKKYGQIDGTKEFISTIL